MILHSKATRGSLESRIIFVKVPTRNMYRGGRLAEPVRGSTALFHDGLRRWKHLFRNWHGKTVAFALPFRAESLVRGNISLVDFSS